jgi:hypothetical protein
MLFKVGCLIPILSIKAIPRRAIWELLSLYEMGIKIALKTLKTELLGLNLLKIMPIYCGI